ncbi:MAG: hypothetical protein H6739_20055 [Alphaproteobacteria bacterium]|nr:hypothetical protein [Alphaproteobacteria bacterium]
MIGWLLVLGCGVGEGGRNNNTRDLEAWYALTEGQAWTYRDDGEDADPDEAELLHARHVGDGEVELRRGARWTDGEVEGRLTWDDSDGLALVDWELGALTGSGDYPVLERDSSGGDEVGQGGWTCRIETLQEIETFYGVFREGVVAECTGVALTGTYAFGKDVGLVAFEGGGLRLDLVAPW